jgi:hypothetical protein
MRALPNAKSHGLTTGGGRALALTGISAARAEPEIIASAVAAKIIFVMTIPITLSKNQPAAGCPRNGLVVNADRNLERAGMVEKQKSQAFADLLGICGMPREVVCDVLHSNNRFWRSRQSIRPPTTARAKHFRESVCCGPAQKRERLPANRHRASACRWRMIFFGKPPHALR